MSLLPLAAVRGTGQDIRHYTALIQQTRAGGILAPLSCKLFPCLVLRVLFARCPFHPFSPGEYCRYYPGHNMPGHWYWRSVIRPWAGPLPDHPPFPSHCRTRTTFLSAAGCASLIQSHFLGMQHHRVSCPFLCKPVSTVPCHPGRASATRSCPAPGIPLVAYPQVALVIGIIQRSPEAPEPWHAGSKGRERCSSTSACTRRSSWSSTSKEKLTKVRTIAYSCWS